MEEETVRRRVEGQLCDICQGQVHKYKCPGCARKSCSLECVKRHKVEFACSGKRCKTGFVKLSEFGDNQLYSDYYFLEDVSRCVDSVHRDHIHSNKEQRESQRFAQQMHWLRVHAGRRSINFLSQPPGMTKHRINRSKTVRSKDGSWSIRWTVRFVFRNTDVDVMEHNVPEDIKLSELLDKYVHPAESDPVLRHRLRMYVQDGGIDGLQVLLKNEASSKSSDDVLDLNKTLCENLRNKSIVEFPTLVIVKNDARPHPLEENSPVGVPNDMPPPGEEPTEVCSDWSDFEDGEVREVVSSLQLIAQEYRDS